LFVSFPLFPHFIFNGARKINNDGAKGEEEKKKRKEILVKFSFFFFFFLFSAIALALRSNTRLTELNLLGQPSAFGDSCLEEFVALFNYNVTLTKIIWRLDSRKSFAINKLLVRNNTIMKWLSESKDVSSLVPSSCNIPELAALAANEVDTNIVIVCLFEQECFSCTRRVLSRLLLVWCLLKRRQKSKPKLRLLSSLLKSMMPRLMRPLTLHLQPTLGLLCPTKSRFFCF
jgi:hypothetical protein